MDRREMLQESFRGLARTLPSLLGFAGGLGRILSEPDDVDPPRKAACFPKPCKQALQDYDLSSEETMEKEQ